LGSKIDRFQGLFQLAGPLLDHAVEKNGGLEQVIGIALQVEAVLDMLHQRAVDFFELGDLTLEGDSFVFRRQRRRGRESWQIHRFTVFPKAMPVKV
jgi:hypothetical protein